MRILMIAPEPFFEPRGTPFSEFHRIRALTTLGHEVDLVTYPFGADVSMPGLRVFRSLRPPFVHRVKIGPSFAKEEVPAVIEALVDTYRRLREPAADGRLETFIATLRRVGHEPFKAAANAARFVEREIA